MRPDDIMHLERPGGQSTSMMMKVGRRLTASAGTSARTTSTVTTPTRPSTQTLTSVSVSRQECVTASQSGGVRERKTEAVSRPVCLHLQEETLA